MKTALVIVDAYDFEYIKKNCNPRINDDSLNVNPFCKFLNRVCDIQRQKGDIIIQSFNQISGRDEYTVKGLNKNINFQFGTDIFVNRHHDLNKIVRDRKIKKVYFGGFYFGKCISNHLFRIHPAEGPNDSFTNVALNLSMVVHGHSWKKHILREDEYSNQRWYKKMKYYLWGVDGFDRINLIKQGSNDK
tara:strand:+ start:230 stop:796 length:567 start_codon:yes stop_codon:yes gene_type:complete